MTDTAQVSVAPVIEVRHRMRIAMEHAGLKPHDMADALDVAPTTVSRYLNGSVNTTRAVIMAWGMRTGVSWRWILTGQIPETPDGRDVSTYVTQRYERGKWFTLNLAA